MAYSKKVKPHRTLKDGDSGEDVKRLEKAVNLRLQRKEELPLIEVKGKVTPALRERFARVAYLIGLDHRWLTPENQRLVRWPWKRPRAMKKLEASRVKAWDRDRSPHRRLRIGDKGRDVQRVQIALNTRLKRAGSSTRVDVDGEVGGGTWSAWCRAAYLIGLDHRWMTVGNQELMRWPWRRPSRMKKRERRRKAALKKRGRGPAAAIAWTSSHLNVKEHPWGSNSGPGISQWERAFGFGAVPWCGIFVGMALRAAGVKVTSRVASVALIEDDAKAGRNGFRSWHGRGGGQKGDAAVIGGRGVHVELIIGRYAGGYLTDGGNTSCEGCSGSQSNGGQSARRHRPFSSVYGCARPAY